MIHRKRSHSRMSSSQQRAARCLDSILDRELLKPDESMDVDLIWECLLYLYPECEARAPGKQRTWKRIARRIEVIERKGAIRKKAHSPFYRIRRLASLAAICIVSLSLGIAIAHASGFDIWKYLVSWNRETLFIEMTRSAEEPMDAPHSTSSTHSWDEKFNATLQNLGMTPNLPQWIPQGFTCQDVIEDVLVDQKSVTGYYLNEDTSFVIEVVFHLDHKENSTIFFEQSDQSTVYQRGDNVYYLMNNMGRNVCLWNDGAYEISISGDISEADLTRMIDTIENLGG